MDPRLCTASRNTNPAIPDRAIRATGSCPSWLSVNGPRAPGADWPAFYSHPFRRPSRLRKTDAGRQFGALARAMIRSKTSRMRIALYQPDIPQNAGSILRTAACLGVPVHVIGPTGFDMTDRSLRRAGLDYLDYVAITRHDSFADFQAWRSAAGGGRLVLATTAAAQSYLAFTFAADDIVLMGRESAGVPAAVHTVADARIRIPIRPGLRSLNVAAAAAMILGEARRQIELP